MVNKDFLNSTNLTKAQNLYIYELIKIVIIYENKEPSFESFCNMLSGFKKLYNRQNLTFISFIYSFC